MSSAKVTLKAPSEENEAHELEIVGTARQCQAAKCMADVGILACHPLPELVIAT